MCVFPLTYCQYYLRKQYRRVSDDVLIKNHLTTTTAFHVYAGDRREIRIHYVINSLVITTERRAMDTVLNGLSQIQYCGFGRFVRTCNYYYFFIFNCFSVVRVLHNGLSDRTDAIDDQKIWGEGGAHRRAQVLSAEGGASNFELNVYPKSKSLCHVIKT